MVLTIHEYYNLSAPNLQLIATFEEQTVASWCNPVRSRKIAETTGTPKMSEEKRVYLTLTPELREKLGELARKPKRPIAKVATELVELYLAPSTIVVKIEDEEKRSKLRRWAGLTGHDLEGLCSWLVARSLNQAEQTGELPPEGESSNPLNQFLDAIESGRFYGEPEIAALAIETGRDVETLTRIQECFKQERSHAPIRLR